MPASSPHAVAEHTVALLMTLNPKFYRAHNRAGLLTREALSDIARVTVDNILRFERDDAFADGTTL